MKTKLSMATTVLALGILILASSGCGDGSETSDVGPATFEQQQIQAIPKPTVPLAGLVPPPSPTPPAFPVVATTTEPVYITTADLDNAPTGSSDARSKIVAHSTLVLIGTVPDAEPRIERISGRLTDDPARPDSHWTTLAYVRDVQVERYLKGSGPSALSVMQPTGHETISPGAGTTPGLLNHVRYSAHDYYFERGGRYLLFLRESEHPPGLWMGTSEPYKYHLFEGRARLRTPAKDPGRTFYIKRGEEELLKRVQDVIDYQSAFASSGIPNGVRWNLESLDGKPPLEGTFVTFIVDGNRYGGGDGCNSFGGQPEEGVPVADEDGAFLVSAGGMVETLMLCETPQGIMEQAEAYKRAVRSGRTFQIDGDRLKILDGSGKVRLVFVRRATLPGETTDLAGTEWRVLDADGEYGDAPLATLAFLNEHLAGGTTACRDFILDYRTRAGGKLSFSGKGMYGSTDSCTEQMVDLERGFRRGLSSDDYAVDDSSGTSVLRIRTYRDEIMSFEPLPPAPEDRIFKERWSLTAFTKPDQVNSWHTDYAKIIELVSDTALTVSFEESSLLGSGECHSYEASLLIEDSRIEVQDVAVSEKPCDDPEALAKQETRFADVLKRATSFQLYGDRLFVQTEDDEALLFRAE